MNDIDWFRMKIECAVNQVVARGLTLHNTSGYGVHRGPGNLWVPNQELQGRIWPTAVFLIGRPYRSGLHSRDITAILDVPHEYVVWFDRGFSRHPYAESHVPSVNFYTAYSIGYVLAGQINQ